MDNTSWIRNPGPKHPVVSLRAAVSTDSAIVTETMLQVMRDGGNAADACVAGSLVQAAVEPFMTNHTGTVTFLYYEAKTGKRYQLDSTGTMPDGLAPFRPIPPQGHGYGAMPPSACIPGFMPGLKAIHERFGTRPWEQLCDPAVRWADSGHPVSTFEYGMHVFGLDFVTYFPEGRDFYMPGGYLTNVGEIFRPPGMVETLRRVAQEGPDWMITGGWADAFIAKANAMGWPIDRSHMTETPPRWVEPLAFKHHDAEVVSLGPPQMQGVFCAMVLGILRHLGIRDTRPGSAEHLFYMAHALRLAGYHRTFFHDPVVSDYGVASLLDDGFHAHLARLIRGMRPKIDLTRHVELTASGSGGNMMAAHGKPSMDRTGANSFSKHPSGSCELSIVDAEGNWVQMMNTLQGGGIPGMVVEGIPMVGAHAVFSGLGAFIDAKVIKGTRVSSVMGNTMVFKGGKPVMSLGSPGNVYCTVPQVLTNLLDFGMDPYAAIDAPRMLPLAEDNSVSIEDRLGAQTIARLKSWGTTVRAVPVYDYHMGAFAMCYVDRVTGALCAVADPRRCGVADGIPA